VITEREFVRSHSSFWKDTLPYCEIYVRYLNSNFAGTYTKELVSSVAPNRRALVNELAFELFTAGIDQGGVNNVVSSREQVAVLYAATLDSMRRFAGFGLQQGPLTHHEQAEAIKLARRTESFVSQYNQRPAVRPKFPGCGMLDSVEGDLLIDKTLVEVKAGDRSYRGVDLRQLLTYCALNYGTNAHDIESIGLLNPRAGTFFREKLGVVCVRLSGEPVEAVLDRIRSFVSTALASP